MLTRGRTKIVRLNDKGATAVEFAVIAALLFFILFGIIEFGFIFMQQHYVANAAREGVRIGVRANNYNCFDDEAGCPDPHVNRKAVVDASVRDYLSTLYNPAAVTVDIPPATVVSATQKVLTVAVEVDNFFPPIISALATLIPGAGFELPETISYTATGDYEDPTEP